MTGTQLSLIIPSGTEKKSFHNTINDTGVLLARHERGAKAQESKIWKWFLIHRKATAIEVSDALNMNLNSARRACTNLTNWTKHDAVKLEMTQEKIMGRFGKNVHYYQLK